MLSSASNVAASCVDPADPLRSTVRVGGSGLPVLTMVVSAASSTVICVDSLNSETLPVTVTASPVASPAGQLPDVSLQNTKRASDVVGSPSSSACCSWTWKPSSASLSCCSPVTIPSTVTGVLAGRGEDGPSPCTQLMRVTAGGAL